MGIGRCVAEDDKHYSSVFTSQVMSLEQCAQWCLNLPGSGYGGLVGFFRTTSCFCHYKSGLHPDITGSPNTFLVEGTSTSDISHTDGYSSAQCYKLVRLTMFVIRY